MTIRTSVRMLQKSMNARFLIRIHTLPKVMDSVQMPLMIVDGIHRHVNKWAGISENAALIFNCWPITAKRFGTVSYHDILYRIHRFPPRPYRAITSNYTAWCTVCQCGICYHSLISLSQCSSDISNIRGATKAPSIRRWVKKVCDQ